jgi:hypothetical protein
MQPNLVFLVGGYLMETKTLSDDQELLSYYDSFADFQEFLVNESINNSEQQDAIKNIISFMKAGTKKNRRKDNFKAYFKNIDIDEAKVLLKILQNVVSADTLESVNLLKKELIEQGMLKVSNEYLQYFSINNSEKVDNKVDSDSNQINAQKKYTDWLRTDVVDLVNKMGQAYENKSLTEELTAKFVYEFKRYLNGRLLLKITRKTARQVVGAPIQLKQDGYRIMSHPFLDSEWELSKPIETLSDENRIKIGDIIAADFVENRNERFMASLLFVDFDNAEVLPQTLRQALSEYVDGDYIEKAYKLFEIENGKDEEIKTLLIKKLLDTSKEVRQLLSEDIEQLKDIQDQIKEEQKEVDEQQKALDESRQEWKDILNRIDKLGDFEANQSRETEEYERIDYNADDFISNLQSLFYYNDDQHLLYEDNIIKSFVYSLQANILTILSGPSGTGKSSIVQALGKSLENVEVRMIPVQSSWTDAQDLLGYFHPTDKAFIPTPFMEAMAEARLEKNKAKIYLICLDEMNLAHIEYYFSELLSAREEKSPSIRLYPKRHWNIAKSVLSEGKESIERQLSASELIELYPPVFEIPSNVRFVGTLNMDHTVKPLSPKVVDRSFIIEINHLKRERKKEIKERLETKRGKIEINYELFTKQILEENMIEDVIDKIQEISLLFVDYPNVSLNSRGFTHIRDILTYVKSKEEKNEMIDNIIYGKLLPRIEVKKSDLNQISDEVVKKLTNYPLSLSKFRDMLMNQRNVKFW